LPTIARADIESSPFLFVSYGDTEPRPKLNDFNRCRFLTKTRFGGKICDFTIPNKHNGSKMRSPEVYTDRAGQSDKIDVFSMGSVFYHLLSGKVPVYEESFLDALEKAKQT
jgi:hypothetical protein